MGRAFRRFLRGRKKRIAFAEKVDGAAGAKEVCIDLCGVPEGGGNAMRARIGSR
jgi:hypothetical protein